MESIGVFRARVHGGLYRSTKTRSMKGRLRTIPYERLLMDHSMRRVIRGLFNSLSCVMFWCSGVGLTKPIDQNGSRAYVKRQRVES
ncbi:hypothetical protein PVK06_018778 [Gossypium arboreum]|nr:hypothetical protein PVK06_018778 [Gossypium arboreum]